MSTAIKDLAQGTSISGVMIPDSKLAREATELVHDTESTLLFNHSTRVYSSKSDRFEVDGANTARAFLRRHNIPQFEIDTVWTAIALHTTPGIPQYMQPVVALLTNGVEMDVLGIAYSEFSDADREAVIAAYPRTEHFKEDRPSTTASSTSRRRHSAM
jgi:hypothetical protein